MVIKPTQKPVKEYYATLRGLSGQGVSHEQAMRQAFLGLLSETGKRRDWTFIAELGHRPGAVDGRRVVPDGTLRDKFGMPRGYWEAKDTHDDLDLEIKSKIRKGYPLENIIFEDTRVGVLYQDKAEKIRSLCPLL